MENTETNHTSENTERATTPEQNFFVPIKYNKEVRNLTVEKAAELSQKGLKYESIEKDLERLKKCAQKENASISEFLSKLEQKQKDERLEQLQKQCGGNSEIANHILELESKETASPKGFDEFSEYFPDLKYEDIPESVIEAAAQKNGILLDEYLRYEAKSRISAAREQQNQKENKKANTGSLVSTAENAGDAEFIKGLWGR